MKNKSILIIQYFIGIGLIIGWCFYVFSKNDKTKYELIIKESQTISETAIILKGASERLFENGQAFIEKAPKQVILVDAMSEMRKAFDDIYTTISEIIREFYQMDEAKLVANSSFILPIQYNESQPVNAFFNQKKGSETLIKEWQRTIEIIEKAYLMIDNLPDISSDSISYYQQQQEATIRKLNLVNRLLTDEKVLNSFIKKCDVVHAQLFFTTLKYELTCLEYELIRNTSKLFRPKDIPPSEFIIEMKYETPPIVGQPFTMDFYAGAYVTQPFIDLNVTLNGKELKMEDGMAIFKYTPKTLEPKYFDIKISIRNRFTGETNVFREKKKRAVAE